MTALSIKSGGGFAGDPVLVADKVRKTASEHGSEGLRRRLEWMFQREAERLGIPIADARLLCVNSVRAERRA